MQCLRDTKAELRQALRRDKSAYLSALAAEAAALPTRDVVARLRPILQAGGRRKMGFTGLPAVRLEDGRLAEDDVAARERWIRYFATLLRMRGESELSLLMLFVLIARRRPVVLLLTSISCLESFPSHQLERAMLSTVCGRAYGPDQVPPEVLKIWLWCSFKEPLSVVLEVLPSPR